MLIGIAVGLSFARRFAATVLPMSSQVYQSTEWTFTNTASETVEVFDNGENRNKLSATAATSVEHKLTKSFAVTAGEVFRLSVRLEPGTTRYTNIGIFKGTTLQAAASIDLEVGTTDVGILSSNVDGSYGFSWDYTIPASTTSMTIRVLVQNSARTGTYVQAGENIYAGLLTFATTAGGAGGGEVLV